MSQFPWGEEDKPQKRSESVACDEQTKRLEYTLSETDRIGFYRIDVPRFDGEPESWLFAANLDPTEGDLARISTERSRPPDQRRAGDVRGGPARLVVAGGRGEKGVVVPGLDRDRGRARVRAVFGLAVRPSARKRDEAITESQYESEEFDLTVWIRRILAAAISACRAGESAMGASDHPSRGLYSARTRRRSPRRQQPTTRTKSHRTKRICFPKAPFSRPIRTWTG